MAAADYYLCDVCGCKTFYDAQLSYGEGINSVIENENPFTKHPWPDGDVGWMVVICKDCAWDHVVSVFRKQAIQKKPFVLNLIREAVAQGWREPETEGKEMDVTLAEAITRKVFGLLEGK